MKKTQISEMSIHEIYGDFGQQYIKKYIQQSPNYASYDFFNTGNNDLLKREILKKFIKGTSKKEIKKQYGEYGIFIISKFLQLLPIEKI